MKLSPRDGQPDRNPVKAEAVTPHSLTCGFSFALGGPFEIDPTRGSIFRICEPMPLHTAACMYVAACRHKNAAYVKVRISSTLSDWADVVLFTPIHPLDGAVVSIL